jgi:type IV pilus assembly protein PilP
MMRIQYLFIPLLAFLFAAQPSFALVPVEDSVLENEEENIPDAMARLMKAPNIDIKNIRDPFLSSFEKNRLDEAIRMKNRKRLPSNKRNREALEEFDLSSLSLVGTFKKAGKTWVASVQDAAGQSYTVRPGNYIGKRGGRIEKIDSQTIYLVEKMMNPAGEIVDRQVTLTLAEINE